MTNLLLFFAAVPAPHTDNRFMESVQASIDGIMREAARTSPPHAWNIPAQFAWRRATMAALVNSFLAHFEVLGDGLDGGINARLMVVDLLKGLEQGPHQELGYGEKWLAMGAKIFTSALKEEIRQDAMQGGNAARGRRHIQEGVFPKKDSLSDKDPPRTAVLKCK